MRKIHSSFLLLVLLAFVSPGSVAASVARPLAAPCPPLPPPSDSTRLVSTVDELVNAVDTVAAGTTILVANGVYHLDGAYLRFATPGVILRSASGDRDAVILDGNYQTTEIVQIVASNVTIADLTLQKAYDHPVHVMSISAGNTLNVQLYNLHILDPGQQAVKINPASTGYYADNGAIACSRIELTAAGRSHIRDNCYTGGIDAHQTRGWAIRDNTIAGFWCESGLSEHGIHLWRGARDALIERNLLLDNARGIGLGLATDGEGRTYPDDPCPDASGYVDDFGGTIRNNMVFAGDANLFASSFGFDCGICLWNACRVRLLHNTVFTLDPAHTFSAIEWRFPNTSAEVKNNLANAALRPRDGALADQAGNLDAAQAGWFLNTASGNLHLRASAGQAIDRAAVVSGVGDDFDGQARPFHSASDIGADEYVTPPFTLFLPLVRK